MIIIGATHPLCEHCWACFCAADVKVSVAGIEDKSLYRPSMVVATYTARHSLHLVHCTSLFIISHICLHIVYSSEINIQMLA